LLDISRTTKHGARQGVPAWLFLWVDRALERYAAAKIAKSQEAITSM
jgi:hypothetical protein